MPRWSDRCRSSRFRKCGVPPVRPSMPVRRSPSVDAHPSMPVRRCPSVDARLSMHARLLSPARARARRHPPDASLAVRHLPYLGRCVLPSRRCRLSTMPKECFKKHEVALKMGQSRLSTHAVPTMQSSSIPTIPPANLASLNPLNIASLIASQCTKK